MIKNEYHIYHKHTFLNMFFKAPKCREEVKIMAYQNIFDLRKIPKIVC